jgi:hypothetical protein
MRYGEISSEMYCEGIPHNNEDPVVGLAHEKAEISEKISELRKDRWNFVCLSLENNAAVIKITNKIGMEASIGSEADLMKDLANYNEKFNKLNPLFDEISRKFQRLPSPSLSGLEHLRADCVFKIDRYKSRIKNALTDKLGIQSKGKDTNDVYNDPSFQALKSEYEEYIKIEEEHLAKINDYISHVNKIISGE